MNTPSKNALALAESLFDRAFALEEWKPEDIARLIDERVKVLIDALNRRHAEQSYPMPGYARAALAGWEQSP